MACAGAFLLLSAFNIGQHLRGETDCGCFLIEVPPLATAAFDLAVSWLLAMSGRREMKTTLILLVASGLAAAGVWLGHDGRLRRALDERPAQPSITVGTQLAFPFPGASLLLVVDSACRRCGAAVRSAERSVRDGDGTPVFVLDLARGDIQELSSGIRVDPIRARPLTEQFAGVEVPLRLHVLGGTVAQIEPTKGAR
ncbi:MAG: hypothetical protein H0W72_01460 [Planctomycetes bacterium]|nr:hypothetical protein [Planctomycetota bacterium]